MTPAPSVCNHFTKALRNLTLRGPTQKEIQAAMPRKPMSPEEDREWKETLKFLHTPSNIRWDARGPVDQKGLAALR